MPNENRLISDDRQRTALPPKISVIIPAYNEEHYLGVTLEHVQRAIAQYQNQTGSSVELIVVDNNSTDRTEEIAKSYGAQVIFEGNNNIAASRNAGAKAARGELLAFLDADDHPSANLLSLVDAVMSSGRYIGGGVKIRWERASLPLALYNGFVGSLRWLTGLSTGLIYTTKGAFERIGGFDEAYHAGEEAKFVWDLKKLGRGEGQKFGVIRQGYVVKSARKFDMLGWRALAEMKFVLNPRLFKDRRSCQYWYERHKG